MNYLKVQVIEEGDEQLGILHKALSAAAHHVHHEFPLVEALVILTDEEQDEGQLELHENRLDGVVVPEPGVELEAGVETVTTDFCSTRAVRIFLFSDLGKIVGHVQERIFSPVNSGFVLFDQVNV